MRFKIPLVLALSVLTLTGCASSGGSQITPYQSTIPADIVACFEETVDRPPSGDITSGQVFLLVADLIASEAEKNACGQRLIAWAEANL